MARRNLNKIPENILEKLKLIKDRFIVVGKAILISRADIAKGKFKNLMIELSETGITFPEFLIPNEDQGKYSNKNAIGYAIKRNDLPKVTRYNTIESPNFGDYSKGTHYVDLPYKAYIKEFVSPKNLAIKIICDAKDKMLEKYPIIFEVDEVLDKQAESFNKSLLFNLNLLQENVGVIGITSSSRSYKNYLQSIKLDWEILPPGNREIILKRILEKYHYSKKEEELIKNRFLFFESLNPKSIIEGVSGLQRYMGALIEDNLIIFENLRYGNAMYLMYEDWEVLSKKSRVELLSGRFGDRFDRILHIDGWENKARELIKKKRSDLGMVI